MAEDIHEIFRREIFDDDLAVRDQFIESFEKDIDDFVSAMAETYQAWLKYDGRIGVNKRRAYVSAFLFNAINNLVNSMKLFISGYTIPSGNLIRQTIESLCTAILCSTESINVYQRVDEDKFSPPKAINLVQRHANCLNINKKSIQIVKIVYEFYHNYSHSSLLALSHNMSLSQTGNLFIGPSFDKVKMSGYKKEMAQRVNLAKVCPNVIDGILLAEKGNNNS